MWAHSSPFEPEEWHYIVTAEHGRVNFQHFQTRICFVGHSHIPLILEQNSEEKIEVLFDAQYHLKPDHRYIFNVGSLGQPRDKNPDPAFVVYDTEKELVRFQRFAYDLESAQRKIMAEGLPQYLADRLSTGH